MMIMAMKMMRWKWGDDHDHRDDWFSIVFLTNVLGCWEHFSWWWWSWSWLWWCEMKIQSNLGQGFLNLTMPKRNSLFSKGYFPLIENLMIQSEWNSQVLWKSNSENENDKKHDIGQETEPAFVMFCHLFGKQLRQYCSKTSLHLKLPKIMQVSILNKRSDKHTKSETGC